MTPRDIEKLGAIGYEVKYIPGRKDYPTADWMIYYPYSVGNWQESTKEKAWAFCMADSRSSRGMKATMADKIRWLEGSTEIGWDGVEWFARGPDSPSDRKSPSAGRGASPEAAVDALFRGVP